MPDAPSTTGPVSIAVQVRNTAAAPASRILIRCEGYGAYENLTQMRTQVAALGPGEGVQVEFRIQPTSSGTIHLVVSAEAVSTGGSGEWLRIEVP